MGIIETIKKIEREEGFEKGKQEVVENLISKLGLSDKQVAEIAEIPVSSVKRIRTALKRKTKTN